MPAIGFIRGLWRNWLLSWKLYSELRFTLTLKLVLNVRMESSIQFSSYSIAFSPRAQQCDPVRICLISNYCILETVSWFWSWYYNDVTVQFCPWWWALHLIVLYFIVLYYALLLSIVWFFATPWTVVRQAPLSMGILQARILERVAMPSSRGSSQPRDWTQVSCIAGRFCAIWGHQGSPWILEWVAYPSPGDLPDPGRVPQTQTCLGALYCCKVDRLCV